MSLMAKNFPVKEVSFLARMEARSRQNYRPIYSIHRWWARRLGVIFRTIPLSLFARTENPQHVLDLSKKMAEETTLKQASPLKKDDWDSYPPSLYFLVGAPRDVLDRLKKYDPQLHQLTVETERTLSKSIILDPFFGGGTTLVEFNRLGGNVIGYDINPMAWWTTRMELTPCTVDEIKKGFNFLKTRVKEQLLELYKTRCPHCKSLVDAMYVFWVRWIHCPECANEIYLFKYHWIVKPSLNRLGTIICPNPSCFHVFPLTIEDSSNIDDNVQCPSCGDNFNPNVGAYHRGKYSCHSCGHVGHLKQDLTKRRVKERLKMHAIEFYCENCNQRGYHPVYPEDKKRFEIAATLFEEQKDDLLFPRQEIPSGAANNALLAHGFRFYQDLFTKRQLLGLSWLLKAILELENVRKQVKELLLTAFSSSLEYHNMLCQYNYSYRKITNLFNHHAYTKTTIPVENNIWGAKYGAGTYRSFVRKVIKAKQYAENPFDRRPQDKTKYHSGKIGARFVSNPRQLLHQCLEKKSDGTTSSLDQSRSALPLAYIACASSLNLETVPSNSIDAVITDPPYYDNIQYSELSNFFHVWLRLGTKNYTRYFQTQHVDKNEEIIGSKHDGRNHLYFKRLLTKAWKECHRVLKNHGRLVFTYHHSTITGWIALLLSLVDANFIIEEVFPVLSEISYNPHVKKEASITHDIIFLCKKRDEKPRDVTVEQLNNMFSEKYHEIKIRMTPHQLRNSDDLVVRMGTLLKILSHHQIKKEPTTPLDGKQRFSFYEKIASQFV